MSGRVYCFIAFLGLTLTAFLAAAPPEKTVEDPPVTAKDLPDIWKEFGSTDEDSRVKILKDIGRLAKVPTLAVPFLKERLKPVAAPDAKKIEQAIADLDSNEFQKREQATKDLATFGPLASPILEKKVAAKTLPPDSQNRLEELIERFEDANRQLSGDTLRGIRGIEVLLQAGTPEARTLLETLARGADGARLTVDSRKALAVWPVASR